MADADKDAAEEAAAQFIRELWGLQGAGYAVLGLRYLTHLMFGRPFAWDDFLMLLATIAYTAESVAAHYVVAYWKGFANNGMKPEEREALQPDNPEWQLRVNGSKTHVIGLLLYTTVLWLLKGCWVIYYSRMTEGIRSRRRVVFWTSIVIPVTYISCLLVAFLKCIPFNKQWQIKPEPPNSCMPAISYIQTLYVMGMNTATDFLLMSIPLPMIYKAKMPWRKKISLVVMFSGAFLEMAFGIARAASVLILGDKDPAQSGYWSVRESFVSFVLTNMPMIYPLFKRFIEKGVSMASGDRGTGLADSHGYRLGSYRSGADRHSKKKRSNIDPTLDTVLGPGESKWGSEERIVTRTVDKGTGSGDEVSSLQGSDDRERVARRRPEGGPYAEVPVATPNTSTAVQGAQAAGKGKGGKWRAPSRDIVVTTEYSVSMDDEAARRQAGSRSPHPKRSPT